MNFYKQLAMASGDITTLHNEKPDKQTLLYINFLSPCLAC